MLKPLSWFSCSCPAVLWWSHSFLPRPLEGAAFPGLHLGTPDPSFHQRTPVPDPRSPFREVPDETPSLDRCIPTLCKRCFYSLLAEAPLSFLWTIHFFSSCVRCVLLQAKPSTVLVPLQLFPQGSPVFEFHLILPDGTFCACFRVSFNKELFFINRALSPCVCVWVLPHHRTWQPLNIQQAPVDSFVPVFPQCMTCIVK